MRKLTNISCITSQVLLNKTIKRISGISCHRHFKIMYKSFNNYSHTKIQYYSSYMQQEGRYVQEGLGYLQLLPFTKAPDISSPAI